MANDRIKITEMPIATSLNGLRTYGVDENNFDVQVPINLLKGNEGKSAYEYYLETTTEVPPKTEAEFSTILGTIGEITDDAETATTAANQAAQNAQDVADTYATILDSKLDETAVKQTTGTSATDVMSQKAVTDELNKAAVYNITNAIPLSVGQYYTSTTARAAVPTAMR